MNQLALRAEITKLSRLLQTDEKPLSFLEKESVASVRALREACNHALHQGDSKLFHRLAASTKLMPSALVAVIAKAAMGPTLCSRVTGLIEPDKAVDIAKRLPIPFLSQVTLELDPRRARAVLQRMSLDIIVAVAKQQVKDGHFITMARFVDDLTDEAIDAVADVLSDADILRVGAYVESPKRLDELISRLSDERLRGTLRAASREPEVLWDWTLVIWQGVSAKTRRRLGELALLEEQAMISMARTLKKQGLWDSLLATATDMSKKAQAHLAAL